MPSAGTAGALAETIRTGGHAAGVSLSADHAGHTSPRHAREIARRPRTTRAADLVRVTFRELRLRIDARMFCGDFVNPPEPAAIVTR